MASSSGLRKAPSLKRNSSETGTTPRDLGHQQNLGDAAAIGSPSPTQYQGGKQRLFLLIEHFSLACGLAQCAPSKRTPAKVVLGTTPGRAKRSSVV